MSHRFYLNQDSFPHIIELTDTALVHQLTRVLKLRLGEEVILFNGHGQEVSAQVMQIKGKLIILSVTERRQNLSEPKTKVTLYLSIIKKDNFDWAVQKCTEAGVSKIIPLKTSHTVKQNLNPARLAKIIKEAAEQCGRDIIPELANPVYLPAALAEASQFGQLFLFHGEGLQTFQQIYQNPHAKPVSILIGPEGGFTPEEINEAASHGAKVVTLGPRTLRAETAAIVATFLATA